VFQLTTCDIDQSIIVRAQGEARSAELIGESMRTNKGFLELRRLEAARDIANVLATSGNQVMLDSQSLLLNGEQLTTDQYWLCLCYMQWLVAMRRRYSKLRSNRGAFHLVTFCT
jgi:hypothetical protein